MKRLEVSCAVRLIYIYVVRRQGLTFHSAVVIIYTTCCNFQTPCILPSQFIYRLFLMILKTNRNNLPTDYKGLVSRRGALSSVRYGLKLYNFPLPKK